MATVTLEHVPFPPGTDVPVYRAVDQVARETLNGGAPPSGAVQATETVSDTSSLTYSLPVGMYLAATELEGTWVRRDFSCGLNYEATGSEAQESETVTGKWRFVNGLQSLVPPTSPEDVARLADLEGGVFNVQNYGAVGDGVTDDRFAIQDTIDAAYAANGGVVLFPHSEAGYAVDAEGNSSITLRSRVWLLGTGYGGRLIRTGEFQKARGQTFFTAPAGPTDITIQNLYIEGRVDDVILATGDLDGSVTFGASDTHTDGEAAGVVKLKNCIAEFGEPALTPTFGVAVIGSKIIRYTAVIDNGTPNATLTGCYGNTGTAADGTDVAEHSGNMRMPCFNFSNGGTRINFLNNTVVGFPGQGFQGNNLTDFKVMGNYTQGHRGIIFRRNCTGIVGFNQISSNDDICAFLSLDGLAPPEVTIVGNIFTSIVDDLEDPDAEPEFAGNGIVLYGADNSAVYGNRVYGTGATTGASRSGIKISGGLHGSPWSTSNTKVYGNNVIRPNGYGIYIGGLGDDPFYGENVKVDDNLVIGAALQGIFIASQTADSTGKNVRADNNDLIDCGHNEGANDQGAIRTSNVAGASWPGLSLSHNHIIRPGRHGILMDADMSAPGGSVEDNYVEDPNQGNTASTTGIVVNGFSKGAIRNNRIVRLAGTNKLLNGISVGASNSTMAVNDNFIDPDAISGARILDLSVDPQLIRGQDIIRKTADETVNNSTTLQDDNHLKFVVAVGEVWHVVAVLNLTAASANADYKIGWSLPGTSTYQINAGSFTDGVAAGGSPATWNTTTVALGGAAGSFGAEIHAFMVIDTAGTAVLQWAQNTQLAENNTIKAGSYLRLTRL